MTLPNKSNETQGNQDATTPGQETTPASTEPGYVTNDQLNAVLKNIDDKLSNLYRGIQSKTDKLDSRVQRRMSLYEKAAAEQGITLTPSQKQQLEDYTTIEELRAVSENQSTPNASPDLGIQTGETDDEFANRVNVAAETMLKAANITFDENDPEVELINSASEKTAEEYLDAHREAIRLKKERLAKGETTTPSRAPAGGAPGAIGGSPNPNPNVDIKDMDGMWERAKKARGL